MEEFEAGARPIPSFDRLDAGGVDTIHEASLHIIEELGIQVKHETARELVVSHGGSLQDDDLVTIPRGVVESAVNDAPARFTIHARNPDHNVTVGGDGPPVRAPAYGPANVRTFEEGRRRATIEDYESLLKLSQVEDVITSAGFSIVDPVSVSQDDRHLELTKRALTLTDMPLMGSTFGAQRAEECFDLVRIAMSDESLDEPCIVGLINTVPPRSFDTRTLGALLTYAEYGQPQIISSFTMAGASGPKSLAASMAQANAENLVGITIAQLHNPGTPVVYGVPSSNIDPRYGSLSIASPESAMFTSFAGQMARYYGVPSRGGGGLSDGKTVDFQSGFESMFLQAVTAFSDIDFVLHSAGVLESYSTISPEKFVLDCEAIRYLDRFREGFPVNAASFPFERMAESGPAGHFLDDSGTNANDTPFFQPAFVDKRSHGDWSDDGAKSAFEQAHDRVREQLAAYEQPPLPAGVEQELQAYIRSHRSNG